MTVRRTRRRVLALLCVMTGCVGTVLPLATNSSSRDGGSLTDGGSADAGPCAGVGLVFCDDFTDAGAAATYRVDAGTGLWTRQVGALRVGATSGAVEVLPLLDDVGDFDVTVWAQLLDGGSYGLRYAADSTWGFEVLVGGHGVTVAELHDNDLRTVAYAGSSPSGGSLRVRRQGTQLSVWSGGAWVLTGDDDGIARHGSLGLSFLAGELTGTVDGGLIFDGGAAGAVFTLFRIDSAGPPFSDDGGYSATNPEASLGTYCSAAPYGAACADEIEFWLGRPVLFAQDFEANDSWQNVEGPGWQLPSWQAWKAERAGRTLVLSVPLFPSDPHSGADGGVPSLAACGHGDYDAHWVRLGASLVAANLGDTWLRPGWEFNGSWQPWAAASDPKGFANCFHHLVTAMRSASGSSFQFIWNANLGYAQLSDPTTAYPGDDVVDVIGVDAYDVDYSAYPASGPITEAEQTTAWGHISSGFQGLAYYASLAKSHGKPLAIPEWGVWATLHGGGDNSIYLRGMSDFIANPANNVVYQSYFNVYAGDGDHRLYFDTQFPLTAVEYHRAFGR